jgi:hypothetical protein
MSERLETIVLDASKDVKEIGQCMVDIIEKVLGHTLHGMSQAGDHNISHHLYVATTTAAAILHITAKIMTMPEDESKANEWNEKAVSRVAVLAAGLLATRCLVPGEESFCIDFSPISIRAAIEAAEKITGENNDHHYNPSMVKMIKTVQAPADLFDNSGAVKDMHGDRTVH